MQERPKTTLSSENPANGQILGEVSISTEEEIIKAVEAAQKAKATWFDLCLQKRIEILNKTYDLFSKKQEELAHLITQEMGMPISQAKGEVASGLDYFRWYLDNVEKSIAPEVTNNEDGFLHTVYYEPIGVAAVIAPWNYPFSNFVWGVIPNLLVGNVVAFKHSEECPLCGKFIADVMAEAGLSEGVFAEVYGDGTVGEFLVNQNVNLIWFTGSTKVGKSLYELAAKKFIKVILELGGSAPGIVFDDIDLDMAVESVYNNRFSNAGQMCDALKRLLIQKNIAPQFIAKLKNLLATKKVGNPEDADIDIGPLVAERQVKLLKEQVDDAVQKGAEVVMGGKPMDGLGNFFEPTILMNIKSEMRVWNEEVFGPVLPVMTFETEEEGIKLANDTNYGLGAYLYTNDQEKIKRVSEKLESGMVSVNGVSYVFPFNPFGGYKNSGMGREHGKYGFQELTQIKVVSKKL